MPNDHIAMLLLALITLVLIADHAWHRHLEVPHD